MDTPLILPGDYVQLPLTAEIARVEQVLGPVVVLRVALHLPEDPASPLPLSHTTVQAESGTLRLVLTAAQVTRPAYVREAPADLN